MKSISITQQRPTDLHPCDGCHTPLWCSTFGPVVFMLVLATAHHFRKTTSLFLDGVVEAGTGRRGANAPAPAMPPSPALLQPPPQPPP